MTNKEFEEKLKEIDPKFEIVPHPRNPELAGVYYDRNIDNKTGFIITAPAGDVREDFDPKYRDSTEHPHNSASKIIFACKEHLRRMETDAEYKSLFYEKLPN